MRREDREERNGGDGGYVAEVGRNETEGIEDVMQVATINASGAGTQDEERMFSCV